jgi:ABC-type multidrug transport system ATPase subunit
MMLQALGLGMELVTSPDVLVLDEPTSGLDAAAAASMVAVTLRGLASRGRGRVVVMSIHQPSPRSFRALDRVMLLAAGRADYKMLARSSCCESS